MNPIKNYAEWTTSDYEKHAIAQNLGRTATFPKLIKTEGNPNGTTGHYERAYYFEDGIVLQCEGYGGSNFHYCWFDPVNGLFHLAVHKTLQGNQKI